LNTTSAFTSPPTSPPPMHRNNSFSTVQSASAPQKGYPTVENNAIPFFLVPEPNGSLKFEVNNFPFFYEESTAGHWGVETDFSSGICAHCTLSLLENPEGGPIGGGAGPSVVVFPKCGHAFHNFCNDDQSACVLCFNSNMESWTRRSLSSSSS